MREQYISGLLVVLSVMFSLLVGEVGLRFLGYAGAPESILRNVRQVGDPILNWRFIPNSTVQDGRVISHYNSAGFRDAEHPTAKAVGVTRIVVVGDSVTEGNGVAQEDLFVSHIQTLLGQRYEVINLGMSGLNTPQEIHLLKMDGLRYSPDVVVVNFVLNDCDFFSRYQDAKRFLTEKDTRIGLLGDLPIDPRFKRWLKSSALIYFVKGRAEHLLSLATGKEEKNYYVTLWENPACRNSIRSGFDALQVLKQQHGFSVHVVIWPLLIDYKYYRFSAVHQWVKQQAEQKGFKVLDLLPVYSSLGYRDLQVTAEDNVHPNSEGHRLSAQAYVDWTRQSSTSSLRLRNIGQWAGPLEEAP
jgi:lysophospholipase L1-like esterase